MDMSPPLLLLLTLGFCCPGIYGHALEIGVWSPKDITQLQVGQKLELQCRTDTQSGAFWIQQDKGGTLHFIVFISSSSRATFQQNQKTSTRFEARREGQFYLLVVKSFTLQDEGNYFCVTSLSQMLYFSPGQLAFLPATTTVAPTTPAPTTPEHTTQCDITEKCPCLKTPDPGSRMQEDLGYFCVVFLWVPLAGLCLLLLQLLAMTIVLCRRKAHHYPL